MKYVIPNKYLPGMTNRFYLRSRIVKNKAELVTSLEGEPLKRKNLAHVQPSEMVSFLLSELCKLEVKPPIRRGDILINNIEGTGVDLVTREV